MSIPDDLAARTAVPITAQHLGAGFEPENMELSSARRPDCDRWWKNEELEISSTTHQNGLVGYETPIKRC